MTLALPEGYEILSEARLPELLADRPQLAERLGGAPSDWSVHEVSDGNMNLVFLVSGPAGAVVVKQTLPYIRVIGESWPFPLSRMTYEHAALAEQGRLCPDLVPALYDHEPSLAMIAIEALAPHVVLRKGLVEGVVYPHLAAHMARFLAATLFHTSDIALTTPEKKALMARFAGNAELCAATEDVIFSGPYWEAPLNRWTRPHLDAAAARLRADTELKRAAAEMKLTFRTATEALIHGDLHTGSILATPDDTRVIDPEWAFHGPMGFDVGALLGNLLLAYIAQPEHARPGDDRGAYRAWLLETMEAVWTGFEREFLALWQAREGDEFLPHALFPTVESGDPFRERWLRRIFGDSLGFAGCKMIRRVLGISHVEDFEAIADPERRAAAESRALDLARQLLVGRNGFSGIADVAAAARALD